jgi:acetyltransferase
MSTYRLDRLFAPRSLTIVGASPREKSLGRAIIRDVRSATFGGPVHLANPRCAEIDGIATVKSLGSLVDPPDLVVITVPAAMVPRTVAEAGRIGAAGAIIITAGLGRAQVRSRKAPSRPRVPMA